MNKSIHPIRNGEYSEKGEYHRELDRNWRYYPIYLAKIDYLKKLFTNVPKKSKILDLGCGEGVFIQYLVENGFDAYGIDLNYSSNLVTQGNILRTGLEDDSFDVITSLDVLEHLNYSEQNTALAEIYRILKPGGTAIISVPNLAHFSSRFSFLLTGRLLRTSSIERHPGDRPYIEFRNLISRHFIIQKSKGIFPTFPLTLYLTVKTPSIMVPWHNFLNALGFPLGWCFLNIFTCSKLR